MKKIIILLTMILVLSSFASAVPTLQIAMEKDIRQTAHKLKGENLSDTVYRVQNYLEDNIKYQYFWYARGFAATWYQKLGDCTDKAELAMIMYDELNITARISWGYVKIKDYGWYEIPHAWIEYYDDTEWINYELSIGMIQKVNKIREPYK